MMVVVQQQWSDIGNAYSSHMCRGVTDEIQEFIPNLRRYARSLASNVDDADDVVQETLTLALSKLHQFRPGSNLRAWLFTIARNAFITQFRQKRPFEPIDEECGPIAAPTQEICVALREVERAYRRLSPPYREVLALVVFEGMSYEETGDLLGIPVGTVRSRLSRARSALQRAMSMTDPHAET